MVSVCLKHYENVHSDNNLTLRATRILIYCSQSIYKYLHIQYLGNIIIHILCAAKSSLKSCVIVASRLPEIHANCRSEITNRVKHKPETATVCLQSQSCCFWNVLDLALQQNLYCKVKLFPFPVNVVIFHIFKYQYHSAEWINTYFSLPTRYFSGVTDPSLGLCDWGCGWTIFNLFS